MSVAFCRFLVRRIGVLISTIVGDSLLSVEEVKGALIKPQGLEKDIEVAARRYPGASGILVLIDADRDCPAILGPELLRRASSARPDLRIGVVVAKCEYEAWFIAAFRSVSAHADVHLKSAPTRSPEEILGAKQWLAKHMRLRNMLKLGISLLSLS